MCDVEAPKDASEAKAMKICGILNICPFPGLSAAVYGCIVGKGDITCIGIAQYLTVWLFFGWIWAIIYGAKMICCANEWEKANPSATAAVPAVANPPPPVATAPAATPPAEATPAVAPPAEAASAAADENV